MNSNNRNVRLQQHVVLLTVMEHAEDLIGKARTSCYKGIFRKISRFEVLYVLPATTSVCLDSKFFFCAIRQILQTNTFHSP